MLMDDAHHKEPSLLTFSVTNDLTYDQRMIRICTSLSQEGYQVLLIGRKKRTSVALSEQPFQQYRLACFFERGKWFYVEYQIRLFWFLLRQQPTVLTGIDLDSLLPNFLVSKIKRKPLVYDAHEYYVESPEIVRRPAIKKIWSFLANWLIPKVDFAYTVGPALAAILTTRYTTQFDIIRNVPFLQTSKMMERQVFPPILLYQGVLNEGRGLEALIRVLPCVDHAVLWLIGEGDQSDALRHLVRELGLKDRVVFWGYKLPSELPPLTRKATIGFNLLADHSLNYYYSLANKAFDYVQAGLPSIHMDFPEYRALNAQYEVGVLIPNLAQEVILQAIHKLLNDQPYYDQLHKNCMVASTHWNWQTEEKKITCAISTIRDLQEGLICF